MTPHGWKCVAISSVAEVVTGSTPPTNDSSNYGNDELFVSPGDLGATRLVTRTAKMVSAKGFAMGRPVPFGATLVTCIGSSIGKTGMAGACLITNQQINAAIPRSVDPLFLYYAIVRQSPTIERLAGSQALPILPKSAFERVEILIPDDRHIQEETGRILSLWDEAIEKTQRLIAAKSMLLDYLRERHLNKPKQSIRVKLHAVTRESTARNGKRLGREAIMAVTKQIGMRPMREETVGATIDRYKIVRPNAFAYNPMRLNIGSIAMCSFDHEVLVSPDYVVFECDDGKLLPSYLNHLRRTRLWDSHFEAAGSGGVRIRIYYDDLGAFSFRLPELDTQRRIVALLDACTKEIETLERYRSALQIQKRSLMQKLLTGRWRVPIKKGETA